MKEHFKLLGLRVHDSVTGFKGVVSCISFDLAGCVQAVVTPAVDEKGALPESRWFDTKRLIADGDTSVIELPTFELVPGGQELPRFESRPDRR